MTQDNSNMSYIEEKLPLRNKLAFAAISFTSGLFSGLVLTTGFTAFYNEKFNVSESFTIIAWALFIVWNAVNDPLIGFIQERTGSEKLGRRTPYIRYGAPLYAGLFILSWFPFLSGEIGLLINMILILYVFDTIFTMIGLISYSLPAEMTVSEHARSDLMVYGSVAQAFALLLSFVFPQLLNDQPYNADPMFEPFRIIMVILGIIGGIILFISSFYLKENKYTILDEPLGFKDSFVETVKNKPFLIFEAANFIYLTGQYILTQGVFYYLTYVLGLDSFVNKIIPLLVFFLCVFIFLPVHSRIVNKVGLKKAFIFTLAFTGLSFLVGFLGVAWTYPLALISMTMIGFGFSGFFLTNQLVMADVIDYDELRTDKRRETSYSGMNALITKPANSLGPIILISVAAAFGFSSAISYDSYTPAQLANIQVGIMLGFTLIPALLIIVASGIMFFFPLHGKEWRKKKESLHEKHKQKEKDFIERLKKTGKL